ncbi:MAG TPA: PilZ domain-containing protein [Thermoanaerobaculia bacterium]|nr:PilZ domain-containing protein [Thermoanaerobaculia bacterium]
MIELRQYRRFPVDLPIEAAGRRGKTVDISASGIAFESTARLQPGDSVTVHIAVPNGGAWRRVRCNARVVRIDRSRRIENGRETMRVAATVQWLGREGEWFDLVSERRSA